MTKGARIGLGRTAEIFAWGDGQILKLFFDWAPAGMVNSELKVARALQAAGLAAPKVEGGVEVDGRRGIIYERIDGPSMLRTITAKPWTIVRSARLLAELQVAMHACSIPELPSQRARLEERIRRAKALSSGAREAVLKVLARLPDDDKLCHGDFHPDNVLMSRHGLIIIDWMDASRGHPLADVARTSLLLSLGSPPPGTRGRWLIELARSSFHRAYLSRYMQLRSVSREQIDAWQAPITAARLIEGIAQEESRLVAIVEAALL